MPVKDRLRDIAFNIAADPNPSRIRTLRIESLAQAAENNESAQIQEDMRNLGLNVNSISAPQFQGGAGGSTITVTYTYDPNANINENLRAAIARESAGIANEKAQSGSIIRNHIQDQINTNPNNSDKWEISLDPSDNPQYLLEYLGKNSPEGSFSIRETNVNNEHQQIISINKSSEAFRDLALLEGKLVKDQEALSSNQKTEKAADKFAETYVKQIVSELKNQIPGSKSSAWKSDLQQPINNPHVLAAIGRGISKEFPGLQVAKHEISTPTSGMMEGRSISTFTITMKSPEALSDPGLNKLLGRTPTPAPSSATTSPVLSLAPSEAPKPSVEAKDPMNYYNALLNIITKPEINNHDKAEYKNIAKELLNDPNTDRSDPNIKIITKHTPSTEPQMNSFVVDVLKDQISETRQNTASQESSASSSSPGTTPSLTPKFGH